MNISDLAAFNPKKLAMMLNHLPDGAVIYGLSATGPWIAMPKPSQFEEMIDGQFYHDGDSIVTWTGSDFVLLAKLTEWDGNPVLVGRPSDI